MTSQPTEYKKELLRLAEDRDFEGMQRLLLLSDDNGSNNINDNPQSTGMLTPNQHEQEMLRRAAAGDFKGIDRLFQLAKEDASIDINIDIRDTQKDGLTALHLAVTNGHVSVVDLLAQKGADVNAETGSRMAPLDDEAYDDYVSAQAKSDYITDTTIYNGKQNGTALCFAARIGAVEMVETLLKHSADTSIEDNVFGTPLHMAVLFGHEVVVEMLLQVGTDINAQNYGGQTPLHEAVWNGKINLVRLLLGRGAAASAADGDGDTPLHDATLFDGDNEEVVKLLIKSEANIHAKNKNGYTPLHTAAVRGRSYIVRLLLADGADANVIDRDGRTPLHYAVTFDDDNKEVIQLLLQHEADICAKDKNGYTALHLAAGKGRPSMVQLLLNEGAPVNAIDEDGHAPLHHAMIFDDDNEEVVQLLLKHETDIDAKDKNGRAVLHFAAANGRSSIVRLQLAGGADANATDTIEATPLHHAMDFDGDNDEVVRLLLQYKANIHAKDADGYTPTHMAAAEGRSSILRLLLDEGADVNATDEAGHTPLHHASQLDGDNEEVVQLLIECKADIHAKNKIGYAPIHVAAGRGRSSIVRLLLAEGAEVNATHVFKETPLHNATGFDGDNSEVVLLLMQYKADIHAKNKIGCTVIHVAAAKGRLGIVRWLLAGGADIEATDEFGQTPLEYATQYDGDNTEMVQLLMQHKTNSNTSEKDENQIIDELHEAAREGKINAVRVLLNKGAAVNATDACKNTPLHYATLVNSDKKEVPQLLMQYKADIHAINKMGCTTLHLAASKGRVGIVRLLLTEGADVDATNRFVETPLHYATEYGSNNEETVQVLIEYKADIHAKNKVGCTALHLAASKGMLGIVRLLLVEDVDVNAADEFGHTPLDFATEYDGDNTEVVQLLLELKADINRKNKIGYTTLHRAAGKGRTSIVRLLLAEGTGVNATNQFGETPLHIATAFDGDNYEVVQLLMQNKADIKAKTAGGFTALHIAAGKGRVNCARLLLEKGAAVDTKEDEFEETPLHITTDYDGDNEEMVQLLLEFKADINAKNKIGVTTLHMAAGNGKSRIVRSLLTKGADTNATNQFGETSLHHAAAFDGDNGEVVRLLIEHKTNIHAKATGEYEAIHLAAGKGRLNMVRMLLTKGADANAKDELIETPLHHATDFDGDNEKVVQLLMQYKADIHANNKNGTTALHMAAGRGRSSIVRLLLTKGADANAIDELIETPLHHATDFDGDNEKVVQLLMQYKADIHANNINGTTALHMAAGRGRSNIVRLLLAGGAEVNERDGDTGGYGPTPLHLATEFDGDNEEVVRLLIEYKAYIDATDKKGFTTLHMAARKGRLSIVRLLLDRGADVHAKTLVGYEPLYYAINAGNKDVTQILMGYNLVSDDAYNVNASSLMEDVEDENPEGRPPFGYNKEANTLGSNAGLVERAQAIFEQDSNNDAGVANVTTGFDGSSSGGIGIDIDIGGGSDASIIKRLQQEKLEDDHSENETGASNSTTDIDGSSSDSSSSGSDPNNLAQKLQEFMVERDQNGDDATEASSHVAPPVRSIKTSEDEVSVITQFTATD